MKRKNVFFGILYYPLVMLVYLTALKVTSLVFNALPDVGLGGLAVLIYGMVFVEIPAVTAVMMRFGLFKLYVDPIAAAEMPLLLYVLMLINQIKRSGTFGSAFVGLNRMLCDNGVWLYLVCLFVFGLALSFSVARKNGQNISYRLISGRSGKKTNGSAPIV